MSESQRHRFTNYEKWSMAIGITGATVVFTGTVLAAQAMQELQRASMPIELPEINSDEVLYQPTTINVNTHLRLLTPEGYTAYSVDEHAEIEAENPLVVKPEGKKEEKVLLENSWLRVIFEGIELFVPYDLAKGPRIEPRIAKKTANANQFIDNGSIIESK